MRAFATALAVIVVMSLAAGIILTTSDESTTQKYTSPSGDVRVSE